MELLKKIGKENQSTLIAVTHDVLMIKGFDTCSQPQGLPFESSS
jgi:ABC-type lipoprotein export system ATPase subunit